MEEFFLEVGETRIIPVDILTTLDTNLGIYIGNLIFKADTTEEKVLFVIEVESKENLFDVQIEILEESLYVLPGKEVIADVTIINLQKIGAVDVDVEYSIIDNEGNVIVRDKETLTIETKLEFLKSLEIPEETKEGRYLLYVRTVYNDKVASASEWFNVQKKIIAPPIGLPKIDLIYLIIFLLILILIIVIIRSLLKRKKGINKKGFTPKGKKFFHRKKKRETDSSLVHKVAIANKLFPFGSHHRKNAIKRLQKKQNQAKKEKDSLKKLIKSMKE